MTDRFEHFTYANFEISKILRKLSADEMEKHGLKAAHAIIFTILAKHTATGLTATQLCEFSGRDKADVSRMLSHMTGQGLVSKEGVNQNRYNGVFKLTESGREIAQRIQHRISKAVDIAGRDLTEGSRQVFYDSLDSILNNLRELSMKGIPTDE